MIAGFPPFYGTNKQEVLNSIMSGKVEYTDPIWETVSEDAKSMLKKMFVLDPKNRISATEALKEHWITMHTFDTKISQGELKLSLRNLRNFRTQMMFQTAVLSYIASQIISPKEEEKIRQIFDIFDTDRDGKLSKKDLTAGLKYIYGDEKRAKKEAENIFRNIDINKKGAIEYNGICYS